jgi:amidase
VTQDSTLDDLDIIDQAQLVRNGTISARHLVEATIARIESVNPTTNAVVLRLYEQALMVADREVDSNAPFAGVPFLVKDLYCHYAGTPTTGASKLNAGFVPDHDSELMARYRRSGLITVGKTNLCEFGTLGTTEPLMFGATRNPWDLSRSSGGSSGGAAAAVASGMVAAAHGGDGAGSIRIPASCCGLFGFKPSRGRITLGPDLGDSLGGIVNEHVLSRSVRDSAALLDATHGPMAGDPYFAPPPSGSYLSQVNQSPGRLRIALTENSLIGTEVHADSVAAVRDAARLCEELGHEVVLDAPHINAELYDEKYRRFWAMTATRSVWAIAQMRKAAPEHLVADIEPFNQYLFSVGSGILAADYVQDLVWFHAVGRSIARFLQRYDVWLTPTLGSPPPLLGHFDGGLHGGREVMDRFMRFLAFTTFANMAGLPSMSVPLFWNDENLPIGTQFTGRYGDESGLFRLAQQLEAGRPWRGRRPNVWARSWPVGDHT